MSNNCDWSQIMGEDELRRFLDFLEKLDPAHCRLVREATDGKTKQELEAAMFAAFGRGDRTAYIVAASRRFHLMYGGK